MGSTFIDSKFAAILRRNFGQKNKKISNHRRTKLKPQVKKIQRFNDLKGGTQLDYNFMTILRNNLPSLFSKTQRIQVKKRERIKVKKIKNSQKLGRGGGGVRN